jgi:hypothetical protein
MRSKTLTWSSCLALLVILAPGARASDDLGDLPGDDLTEQVSAEPIDWRPVITHFYVQPRAEEANPTPLHFEQPQGVLPGLVSAWEDLEPRVKPRGDVVFGQSFRENEPVVSGWRVSEDGTGFDIHIGGTAPGAAAAGGSTETLSAAEKPVQAVLAAQPVIIHVGVDLLMNVADPERKDEILRQFFSLERLELSVHFIDRDPVNFRGVPDREAVTNGRTGIDRSEKWLDIRERVSDFSWEQRLRAGGAYAFRVKAAVSGRVDAWEGFGAPREVAAEIRVVFVDQTIKIDRLSFDSTTTRVPDDDK